MPELRAAKARSRSLLRRLGVDIRRYSPAQSFDARRARLLETRGITTVLDVGANTGQFASVLRKGGFAGRIVSLEPLSEPFKELAQRAASDARWTCHRIALGRQSGPAIMNVSRNSWSSSLLPIEERSVRYAPDSVYVGTERVEVARLDDVWSSLITHDEVVYIKLDVQGYELEVVGGASASTARSPAIELELSLVPLYTGQPLFREVIDELERIGFELFSLEPEFSDPVSGRLLQMNVILLGQATP